MKFNFNQSIKRVSVYGALFLLAGYLGCARLNPVAKEPDFYQSTKRDVLKKDWEKQKSNIALQKEEWQACSEDIEPESVCSYKRDPQFEVYDLEKTPLSYGMTTTALYCPSEKKYWIKQSGGDIQYRCRSLGPFTLED